MTAEERAERVVHEWHTAIYEGEEQLRDRITAEIMFERKRWVMAVMDRDELNDDWVTQKYHDPEFARGMILEGVKIAEEEAAFVAVEAELRRMIPLVCRRCASGRKLQRDGFGWHHRESNLWHCHAGPLHEALREKEERHAESS